MIVHLCHNAQPIPVNDPVHDYARIANEAQRLVGCSSTIVNLYAIIGSSSSSRRGVITDPYMVTASSFVGRCSVVTPSPVVSFNKCLEED